MRDQVARAEQSRYRLAAEYVTELVGDQQTVVRVMERVEAFAVQYRAVAEPQWVTDLATAEQGHHYWRCPPTSDVVRDRDLPRAAVTVLRLTVEVLAARRPASQLAGFTDPRVLGYIQARGHQLRGGQLGGTGRLRACHVTQPCEGIGEVCGLASITTGRPVALAARFELVTTTGWRLTSLGVLGGGRS